MKLNPFSKSPSAFYDKIEKEHEKLNHELAGLKKQLESAKAEEAREKLIYDKLCEASHNPSEKKNRQNQVLSEVYNRAGNLERQISQIVSRMLPLRSIVEAPAQYATAKKTLNDLLARQTSLNSDLEKTDALLAKVGKRIADLDTRNAAETDAAVQSLLDDEVEFAVPALLTKLEMELRLGKVSQVTLQSKREALVVELRELSNAIGEAERAYIACRMVITELELREQLMPIMDLFARASVARHQFTRGSNELQYEIEIPPELIESAEAALAAEMPTA